MNQVIRQASSLLGVIDLPPDKSIAHRAAILAALSEGTSYLTNFPDARDPQSTVSCLRQLGVTIEKEGELLRVEGRGTAGLRPPTAPLDCGNSGTTMRLLAGILAAQRFESVLVGDVSLSSRPMDRIAEPLRLMGAHIDLEDGHAPVRIRPARRLEGITYRLPVSSAQVKSCILLAGLRASGRTTVIESKPSRDHTERMMELDVVDLDGERLITVESGHAVPSGAWTVPRDFSAAAFFLVAASVVPDAAISMPAVGVNPSRTGALDVLRAMGAHIDISGERTRGGEPIADLEVRSSELTGVAIGGDVIPRLIDEIPILAVGGACASGRTSIRDAVELRHKESDRIATTASMLAAIGAGVSVAQDGLDITGDARLRGARIETEGDHRIAMAAGIAALAAEGETTIADAECADISFPGFWEILRKAAGQDR